MKDATDEVLLYRKSRKKNCHQNTEDIFDGAFYKNQFDSAGYFHGTEAGRTANEIHLSLTINTDGVSIFHSSNFGPWPIYFVINELPLKKRYSLLAFHL